MCFRAIIHISEDTYTCSMREYFERAKLYYREVGKTYKLSGVEKKTDYFDINIKAMCKIAFSIAGYHIYILVISDYIRA